MFLGDEYYLLADRPFPPADAYEGFSMHEDGVGMARTLELELFGAKAEGHRHARTASSPGSTRRARPTPTTSRIAAPAPRRASSCRSAPRGTRRSASSRAPTALACSRRWSPASVGTTCASCPVDNSFFGGTTGVTGLLVGEDLARTLAAEPEGHRYLLPDVCLSNGRFLDGTAPEDLPRPVEVIPTDGHALREALGIDARTQDAAR